MTKKLILLFVFILIWVTAVPTYVFGSTIDSTRHLGEDYIEELFIKAVDTLNRAFINFKLSQLPDNEKQDFDNTIKILTIGNSFSQDIDYYLYEIAKSAGVNIIVGNLYNSGCSLQRHWTYTSNNDKAYSYYKWESGKITKTENQTMRNAILDEKWDYITFQQASADSGVYSTYQPYLNNLAAYVKDKAKNKNVKLALNMTWAYSSESTNDGFFYYHYNQKTMFNAIINSYKYASNESQISLIIPCGTAIQNARTNKYLNAVGKELTSDGYHLNAGIGRYIAGLTMFKAIIDEEKLDLSLDDVKFIPESEGITEKLVRLSKKAVKSAIEYPYNIKTIK
ncbi:MAG: DUF4886 domain-containing protein [Sedimentibacter sp.]